MAEVSPLTSVTGLSAEDIEGGDAKEDVLADLHALLGPSVVLVGQNPDSDCTWSRRAAAGRAELLANSGRRGIGRLPRKCKLRGPRGVPPG